MIDDISTIIEQDVNIEHIRKIIDAKAGLIYKSESARKRAADFAMEQYVELTKLGYSKVVSEKDLVRKCMGIIQHYCEKRFNISDLSMKIRDSTTVKARQYFIYLTVYFLDTKSCDSEFSKTLFSITDKKNMYISTMAKYLNFNHATIYHNKNMAGSFIETEVSYRADIFELQVLIEPELIRLLNSFNDNKK